MKKFSKNLTFANISTYFLLYFSAFQYYAALDTEQWQILK